MNVPIDGSVTPVEQFLLAIVYESAKSVWVSLTPEQRVNAYFTGRFAHGTNAERAYYYASMECLR